MANFRSIFISVALISLASQVSSNKDGTKAPSLLNLILYLQVNGQQWLTDIGNSISDEAATVACRMLAGCWQQHSIDPCLQGKYDHF